MKIFKIFIITTYITYYLHIIMNVIIKYQTKFYNYVDEYKYLLELEK